MWVGTFASFSAASSVVAPGEKASVTATVSAPLINGYGMGIYNSAGQRVQWCTGSTCRGETTIAPYTSDTFTAYVTEGMAPPERPANPLVTSGSVTVSTSGWTFTSFSAESSVVAPGERASVTATISSALINGYGMGIYNSAGQRVQWCSGSTCRGTMRIQAGTFEVFRAYVTQGMAPPERPTSPLETSHAVVVSAIPEDELLDSDLVMSLVASVGAKYAQEEACMRLGEAVRTNALHSSVPDATLVCNASGMQKALQLVANTAGAMGVVAAVQSLADTDSGPQPPSYQPDCDHIGTDGACLDQGSPAAEPAPEPEPGGGAIGGGGGIPPRDNCLDEESRTLLEDSMPDQYHHMATQYGTWGEAFQAIADRYGLSVSDSARSWNVHRMAHRGPHPAEYHQWVLDNMELADETANGDVTAFRALFDQWVTQTVLDDPTIVRVAYWKCYR